MNAKADRPKTTGARTPDHITPERNRELRELARKRNEAGRPNPKAHALAVKIIAAGGRDKADPADVARLDRMLERPGAGGRAVPAFLNNEAEAERVRALQAELTCEALAENAADAANVAAASIRRQNLVTNLGNLPDGPIGDALRALSPDARQVYQLRQGMNAKGRRNSWAAVAEHFRSERKRGKRYTRQRVQQIYRAAVEAFPILEDFARLQAGRKCARNVFDCDEEYRETNDVPGAYSTGGHVKAEAVFDKTELAPDREGGARYRVTRDLRNREI